MSFWNSSVVVVHFGAPDLHNSAILFTEYGAVFFIRLKYASYATLSHYLKSRVEL